MITVGCRMYVGCADGVVAWKCLHPLRPLILCWEDLEMVVDLRHCEDIDVEPGDFGVQFCHLRSTVLPSFQSLYIME